MSYLGDFLLGATVSCRFTTVQATGAPTTLSGSPVIACYPSGSTTEITGGITLTVDYDSRTGLNNVAIVASGGNTFAVSTDYDIVITTGTVNSVSVVGYVVGTFSIQNRFTNVAQIGGTTQTPKDVGALNVTNVNTLAGHDPGTTLGTSTLTQAQVTGGAYSVQSASCVLGDTRLANLDATVSSRGTSTLTQTQVTGGAYSVQSASCVLGDTRMANLDATTSSRLASASYTAPPSAADNAAAVQTSATATPLPSNVKKINGTTVNGDGSGTPWGP